MDPTVDDPGDSRPLDDAETWSGSSELAGLYYSQDEAWDAE